MLIKLSSTSSWQAGTTKKKNPLAGVELENTTLEDLLHTNELCYKPALPRPHKKNKPNKNWDKKDFIQTHLKTNNLLQLTLFLATPRVFCSLPSQNQKPVFWKKKTTKINSYLVPQKVHCVYST